MKKVLLFIATEKGYNTLNKAIKDGFIQNIGMVITFKEINVQKSYTEDIQELCKKNKIPCYLWKEVKENLLDIIRENKITGAVTIGWKFLLPLDMNDILEDNLIVFHDSLLPKYRGFSPTPTAIICGEKKIGISVLFATKTVDQGDIILQKEIEISEKEYIQEIIEKQARLCGEAFVEVLRKMELNELQGYQQNEQEATYSIWRSPEDCQIDWSQDSNRIYNFIRAVGSPYSGAFTYLEGKKIIIDKTEIIRDLKFVDRHVGKIWSIINNEPEIICGEGMIKIISAYYENGERVIFNKVRVRLQ